MLNVVCERQDLRTPAEYINILRDMVMRNLPEGMEGQFICMTTRQEGLDDGVVIKPIPFNYRGLAGKTLVLPLGCVIVGPLDKMVEHPIFDDHSPALWELSELFPGQVVNYQPGIFPEGAKIVIFRGQMPHQCTDWVKDVWKIGGGSSAELVFDSNVTRERIGKNIVEAHKRADGRWLRAEEPHSGVAVIAAGGPSLARSLGQIHRMQLFGGADIFAINRVPEFLIENGIVPDAHILMDGIPDVIEFVNKDMAMTRYYASQCDPSVLDAAGTELVMWDPFMEGICDLIPNVEGPFIGGGTTVGTRAIGLAYMLGYRKIHVFGMDSSCEEGKEHAYSQIGFLSLLDVHFNGKVYKTPPQMLAQVEDFKKILPEILQSGVELTIHGDGLLPDVAAEMLRQAA